MAYSFDNLVDQNNSIIEAYASMNSNSGHMPPEVDHTVTHSQGLISHSFEPKDAEAVHAHLISSGYKQEGPSSVYGPATETRYVHPETKRVAYIGKNKRTAWLDIHRK